MRLRARVPATSANLGPGFDSFALALDLCNEVVLDTEAEPGVSWEGEGADELPTDGSDLVSRAIAVTIERQAEIHPDVRTPSFSLHGINRIPIERGLGSSAAAAVAGTALASELLGTAGLVDAYSISASAAELEGHPDNAAGAAFGGLTVVADGYVHRMDVGPGLSPVLLIPLRARMPTGSARAALPTKVALGDAVANVAHGALVVQALATGDPDLLRVSLRDRLHQEARLALVPEVAEVFRSVQRRWPVCLSGSGPSLLVFEEEGGARIEDPGEGWRVLRTSVRARGVEVLAG